MISEGDFRTLVSRLSFFISPPSLLILDSDSSLLQDLFSPVILFLFQTYCFLKNGVSHLKAPVKDIVSWYLKSLSTSSSKDDRKGQETNDSKTKILADALEEFLFLAPLSSPTAPISFVTEDGIIKSRLDRGLPDDLAFESGSLGGVAVKQLERSDDAALRFPDAETVIEVVREFCEEFLCGGDFLLRMMRRMSDDAADLRQETAAETDVFSEAEFSPVTQVLTLRMIDALGTEAVAPTAEMVVDDDKIVAFVRLTCTRCLQTQSVDVETMSMTFGLISTMILGRSLLGGQKKEAEEDAEEKAEAKWISSLQSLLPVIERVEREVKDENIQQMASNARQLLEGQIGAGNSPSSDDARKDTSSSAGQPSKLKAALHDLHDPLIPVRGHALLVLSKLILAKDVEATARREELLGIFLTSLLEEDSYVYLNAVKGLEALAVTFPERVLGALCEEYLKTADPEGKKSGSAGGEATFRRRLTLGESIAR